MVYNMPIVDRNGITLFSLDGCLVNVWIHRRMMAEGVGKTHINC